MSMIVWVELWIHNLSCMILLRRSMCKSIGQWSATCGLGATSSLTSFPSILQNSNEFSKCEEEENVFLYLAYPALVFFLQCFPYIDLFTAATVSTDHHILILYFFFYFFRWFKFYFIAELWYSLRKIRICLNVNHITQWVYLAVIIRYWPRYWWLGLSLL